MIRRWLNYVRGGACIITIALVAIIADPIQRTLFVLSLRLSGRHRPRLQAFWFRLWTITVLQTILRIMGGVRIETTSSVPSDSGNLFIMNHQSLLDISYLTACLDENYPLFVTRRQHATGIPFVSLLLRLYKFPLVDPARISVSQLDELAKTAASASHPLAIFPEGTRTKNGEIGKFRTAGANAILLSRPWSIYLIVVDGLWTCATLTDFAKKISQIKPKSVVFGPFPFNPEMDDPELFMAGMREKMVAGLSQLRQDSDA
jgi:1-acyl-sn-glycerol-3-phosphate acyltransferase